MASWPYSTARWDALRAAKLRANPTCEYCAPRVRAAVEVDHRHAINAGGDPWAWDNLAATCKRCHSIKTRYQDQLHRDIPVKGCDPETGLPLDPGHPWHGATEKSLGAEPGDRRRAFERRKFPSEPEKWG